MVSLGNILQLLSDNEYVEVQWNEKFWDVFEFASELKKWRYIFGYAISDFDVKCIYSDTSKAGKMSYTVISVFRNV